MKNQMLFLFLFALLLSGCESAQVRMAKVCEAQNWRQMGYRIGATGINEISPRDEQTFAECAEVGKPGDRESYDSGVQAGLADYCQPGIARAKGESGRTYNVMNCPTKLHSTMLKEHEAGVRYFCKNSGLYAGQTGQNPEVTCPDDLKMSFQSEYQQGKSQFMSQEIATLKASISSLQREVTDLKSEIEDLRSDISSVESKIKD